MESEEVRDDGERKERCIEQELGVGRGCRAGAGQEQGDDALLGARRCWGGDDPEQQAGKGVFPYSELSERCATSMAQGPRRECRG